MFYFWPALQNEKWFAIEITRKYEKLFQRAYDEIKTKFKTSYFWPSSKIKNKIQDSSDLSIAEQLVLLAQLRDSGALTEQEFQSLKSRLISGA